MKKRLTAAVAILALSLANPALALTRAGANVVDNKVAGVYRLTVAEGGLIYLKRHGKNLYLAQGDEAFYFEIDDVLFDAYGHRQTVHLLNANDDVVTLKLELNSGVMTFANGDATHLTRVRALTRRDHGKIDPFLPARETDQLAPIQASFDCAKAGTRVEKMICSDAAIARLDTTLAARYASVLQMGDDNAYWKQDQRKWMKERNQCDQPGCLVHSYNVRIQDLDQVLQYLSKPAEYR